MNNTYSIYELKNKNISAYLPIRLGGHEIHGKVTRVFRDVIDKHIELTIDEEVVKFKEPTEVHYEEENSLLVFVYQDTPDDDGEELDDIDEDGPVTTEVIFELS